MKYCRGMCMEKPEEKFREFADTPWIKKQKTVSV